jgi:rhodanese-related sulfurtransferase
MTLRIVSLVGLVLMVLVAGCARETPPAEAPRSAAPTPAPVTAEAASVTPAQVRAMLDASPAPALLDVRSPEEFAAGHIRGAILLPHGEVAQRLGEIPATGTIVVFCAVGPRARAAEASLVAAGVDPQRVLHMDGGMVAWEAAGLPVER